MGRLTEASKHGIETGAGVIDSDYRGPVKVLLFNHSDVDFESTSPSPSGSETNANMKSTTKTALHN